MFPVPMTVTAPFVKVVPFVEVRKPALRLCGWLTGLGLRTQLFLGVLTEVLKP